MTALEFKQTVLPTYGAMLALGRHILGVSEAEDVVQDVLKSVWEKHDRIKAEDVRTYVLRSVKNRCLDVLKSKNIEVEMIENVISIEDRSNQEREAAREYMEKLRKVEVAIATLKEPSKTVITLNMQGDSCKTISSATGLSEENVRKILSRTRQKIRDLLKV